MTGSALNWFRFRLEEKTIHEVARSRVGFVVPFVFFVDRSCSKQENQENQISSLPDDVMPARCERFGSLLPVGGFRPLSNHSDLGSIAIKCPLTLKP
jgi:hypothetical protein